MVRFRVFCLAAVVALVPLASCDDKSAGPDREQYVVPLTGAAERPNPVTTSASGSALVTVLSEDSVEFLIYVAAIDSVTVSHFHAGGVDVAGPIMVFTYSGPTTGRHDGVLSSGVVTRTSQFSGVFTFDSLLTRIRAGTTYLNVHTRRNPPGELRGQVSK